MPLLHGPQPLSSVNAKNYWTSKDIPPLGLEPRHDFTFAVYVLLCEPGDATTSGPFYYTGFEERTKLAARLKVQFNGTSGSVVQSHFCKVNKPKSVLLVWPVVGRAAEAYVFYSMLSLQFAGWERKGRKNLCPLGGWVQNDSVLSPVSSIIFERDRRGLRNNCCFNCGGPHYVRDCKKPMRGMTMTCPNCEREIEVSSRGQTMVRKEAAASSSSNAPLQAPALSRPLVPAPAPQRGTKRASPSGAASRASPAKVARNGGKVVSVCGQLYTSLSWFLKKDSPSATQCARARTRCANTAVVLSGGHTRAVAEYAAVPQTGQALRPLCTVSGAARKKLGSAAVPTEVDDIMISRAPDPLPSSIRLSQVLFLVSELEKWF
jgi:hypothetical protein